MDGKAHTTSYEQTGFFSKIVIDYLKGAVELQPFYNYFPSIEGIKKAIEHRNFPFENRSLVHSVLMQQYASLSLADAVAKNLDLLLKENTFTICTAHQPNIFTGPLYFIYKILHAIKLAAFLKETFPQNNFVPVYYMGSEDADLEELNNITVGGKKYVWETNQAGAVGRMLVDKKLTALIEELQGQLSVQTFGADFISILKDCYTEGKEIQQATLQLVHTLFSSYGLVVLVPDDNELKKMAQPIFEEELLHQTSSAIVEKTIERLPKIYKAQAHPRDINLFYLKGNIRERIIKSNDGYKVNNTAITFTQEEIITELKKNPIHFSPNVILRGLFQETILPNIIFIGGGGELAYWLQLKNLFEHFKTSFPLLVLRNSFLIADEKKEEQIKKLGLDLNDMFLPENDLIKKIVQKETIEDLQLSKAIEKTEFLYEEIKQQVEPIDTTLLKHVAALKCQAVKSFKQLERKMLRAEKKKFTNQKNQLEQIKKDLFPNNNLQERVENISTFYTQAGPAFIDILHKNSKALEQDFTVLFLNNKSTQ